MSRQWAQKKSESNSSMSVQKSSSSQRPFTAPIYDAPAPKPTPSVQAKRRNVDWSRVTVEAQSPAGVQAKLSVGAPGDKYEQEADAMANKVMTMPALEKEKPIQREAAPEENKEEEVQAKPLAASITPLVQRETASEENKEEEVQAKSLAGSIQREMAPEENKEEEVQAKSLPDSIQRETAPEENKEEEVQAKPAPEGNSQTSGNLESKLNGSKGGGSPLQDEVRAFMEPRFGSDFSSVRVHTDGAAVQMNKELGAQAFAHGSNIYYGAGKSPGNNELTAHELTHVVQQTGRVQHQQITDNSQRDVMQLKPTSSDADKKTKPFTVSGSGDRITLIPKKSNGKTLYFFFGYTGSKKDQEMRDKEAPDLEDDVYISAAKGFTVVYDKAGSYSDFFGAIYDPNCYGIYWSGHGYMDGNIQSSDGKVVRPEDVDVTKRSSKIAYLIWAACGSGLGAKKWQKAMGEQCQFEGWVDLTNTSEAKDFTSSSWLDSWSSHKGMNKNKELADYINDAEKAK
jgi:hypothetical protein